jgi:TRAP-type C4-dicarboxylate transport system substrate-binding protein
MIRAISIIVFLLAAGWMPQATAITLKIASIAPEGTGWMKDMRAGAAEIKERTNGRVQLKFYGGGVMGTDRQVLLKMRTGQLQGSVFTPSSLTNIYNDIQIYTLPLVFNDLDEVHYVRERMDDDLTRGMEEAGMVTFGLAGGGFALIMSNLPVTALADLKGRKVWIPDGDPVLAETMKSLGLAPVPLPLTDVLTGLQTGLLDIVATPPVGALVLQWHTKVKYVTDFPVLYTLGFMVIDKRSFDRLQAEDQEIVREVLGRVYQNFDEQNRVDNEKAKEALRSSGLEFVYPADGEIEKWRADIEKTNRDLAKKGMYSEAMMDTMLQYVEEYRAGAAEPRAQ